MSTSLPVKLLAATHVAAVGLHSTVIPFDSEREEWSEYAECLEHYFTTNNITTKVKRRAILQNRVGPATYWLIKMLALPKKVTDLTFKKIVTWATKHFNPKPSSIVKRYEFNTRQQEGETLAKFVAELCKIAEYCEYREVLSDMLHDRVVCGISNMRVQCRLLQEPNLTWRKP